MDKPAEIPSEDRRRFDHHISPIGTTIDDIAKEPLRYWTMVKDKIDSTLRSGRRPDGGPLSPAVVSKWHECLDYVQDQIALYKE